MTVMNKETQVKAKIINEIQSLKAKAISAGFDFPTQDPETASLDELKEFLNELKQFLSQEQ